MPDEVDYPNITTFAEFQATGRDCDDLGKALDDDTWTDAPAPGRGRLYLGDPQPAGTTTWHGALYIERRPVVGWPNRRPEQWYLLIGAADWMSDDLEQLERQLYRFAIDEKMVPGSSFVDGQHRKVNQ